MRLLCLYRKGVSVHDVMFQICRLNFWDAAAWNWNAAVCWGFLELLQCSTSVWLADLTADKFLPITLERPKILMPVVNKPIVEHTLEWLQSAGVEQIFMVCRAHSDQIRAHLGKSGWFSKTKLTVTLIDSMQDSSTTGDAICFIDNLGVIRGDFLLISGDIVGDMALTEAFQEHNDRKKVHNAVMTMVIEQSASDWLAHQSWLGLDELYMIVDPITKQLTYYEERVEYRKRTTSAERKLLACNRSKFWRNNLQDCHIDICSPEVLSLFTHNPNYQNIRPDFVKALLRDDTAGYKIFTYEAKLSYANRADNFRSYADLSNDIIQRRRYPVEPNVKNSCELVQFMYTESEIRKSHSQHYDPYSVIGKGSKIGNNPRIMNSVIGENCVIGSDVSIKDCYIWNNVTIEDGCKLTESLICDGVILKSGSVLSPGVVLSFNVVIGQNFIVPAYSKVSLLEEPIKCDGGIGVTPSKAFPCLKPSSSSHVVSGGTGYMWSVCNRSLEEDWRYSVANLPEDRHEYVDPDSDIGCIGDNDYCDDVSDSDSGKEESILIDECDDSAAYIESFEKEMEKILSDPRQDHKRRKH